MSIKRLDSALRLYYQNLNKENDYMNDDIGKFEFYCDENGFDDKDMEDELETDEEDERAFWESFNKEHQLTQLASIVDGSKVTFTYSEGRRAGNLRTVVFAGAFNRGDRTGNGKGTFRGDGFFGYETEGPETDIKKSFRLDRTKDFKVIEPAKADKPEENKIEGSEDENKEEEKAPELEGYTPTLEDPFSDSDFVCVDTP